jgi:hypothetical protein
MADENKGNFSETIEGAIKAAEETVRHPVTKRLAQWGFYSKGFLFIIIGLLGVMVAIGEREGKITAPAGALATIAMLPYGKVLLILFVIGAIGQAIWNILRGVADVDEAGKGIKGIFTRSIAVGVGIFYLSLAYAALSLLITSQTAYNDETIPRTLTAIILLLPLGSILMVLIGLGVMGAGAHEFYSGVSGNFKKNFHLYKVESQDQKYITLLGILSFTARALIFVLIGYFFIMAAINYNPNEAVGLDGALKALAQTYYGKTVLFVTATGLICHGILSLYEARYRRIY